MIKHSSFNINNKFFKDPNKYSINSQFSKIDLQNSLESCEIINKYINLNNHVLDLQTKNQPSKALSVLEKALIISEQLKDNFKKNESECNKGISYFHLNKIKEAINLFQSSFNFFYKICTEFNHHNDIKNLILLCKSGANLCMCKILLIVGKDNCIDIINKIINIISQEEDLNTQIFCLRYISYILFNVNSLVSINNYKESILDLNHSNSNEEANEEINMINQLYIKSFFDFISTKQFNPWINALNTIYQKMNDNINDDSGKENILFHQYIAIILKYEENNEENNFSNEINEAKLKLSSLMKRLGYKEININPEEINSIIKDYKNKLSIILDIYGILCSYEKQLNNNLLIKQSKNQENVIINKDYFNNNIKENYNNDFKEELNFKINSEYYLILLLKYTKTFFKENIENPNLNNDLINNINIALYAINNPNNYGLDFSNINLYSLDSELSNHLCNIFKKLFYIYRRSKLKKYFDKFKENEKNKNNSIKSKMKTKIKTSDKLNDFFERAYQHIYNGEKIIKINYRNNGIKEHYFQVENKTDKLQYFVGKNSDKLKNEFDFDDITKIKIGLETKNVITKLNHLKIKNEDKNAPYKFISFILENGSNRKTLDLVINDEKSARKWFYGINYYCHISNRPYKICSCSKYLLFKIKSKVINKLHSDINNIKNKSFAYYMKKYVNKFEPAKNDDSSDDS